MTQFFQPPDPRSIRWTATIRGGKELALIGRANLAYWKERLSPQGYLPFDAGGYAEITIGSTDLRWFGVQFSELVVSVTVCAPEKPASRVGYYLVRGWNSARFFAYSERTFFSAPYLHGKTIVRSGSPAGITLLVNGTERFRATLRSHASSSAIIDEEWTGPIFLPGSRNETRLYFMAILAGTVEHFDFSRESDILIFPPAADIPVFDMLNASSFEGVAWRLRTNAFHRKSGTMKFRAGG